MSKAPFSDAFSSDFGTPNGAAPMSDVEKALKAVADAIAAADAKTDEELARRVEAYHALEQRIAAVEAGGVAAPPPPLTESANLSTVPPLAQIVDAALSIWKIVAGQVSVNGAAVSNTSGVVKLIYYTGRVYQYNGSDWYGPCTPTDGGPHVPLEPGSPPPPPSPPVVAPPPSSGDAPAVARAAGYTVRTFGPGLTMGGNWFLFDHYGGQNASCVTQLPNGAIRCNGGGTNGFNAHICSARTGGPSGWRGMSFGGGAYFEATLSWPNPYRQVSGWPSWWGNECSREGYGTRTTNGKKDAIEMDFMEWWGGDNYGGAMHRWYQEGKDTQGTSVRVNNDGQPHKYGFLWVPSTSNANGYGRLYFDGVQKFEWTWPRYNPNASLPAGNISAMDVTHQALILGTSSANPMIVTEASVWQASASGNLVNP